MYWYVVNTKPRQEKNAEFSINRLGVETFLPQIRQTRLIRRRKQTVVRPFFPGYIFAKFNLGDHFRGVNFARGVNRVVTCGPDPAIVDEEMVDSIKTRMVDGAVTLQSPSFAPGQPVRIRSGSLEGLEAIFEREMGGQQRVMLLLQALSYQAHVVVDLDQVANL